MIKKLYFILEDFNYPGLKHFMLDVKLAGISILPYVVVNGKPAGLTDVDPGIDKEGLADPSCAAGHEKDSYLVTDCTQGIGFARETGMGYVFYERQDRPGEYSPEGAECIIQGFEETDADFIIRMYQRHYGLPWTILTTDRLRLREMTVGDVPRLYEIYSEPSITMYTEPLFEDINEETEYTRAYIKNQYEFFGFGLWIIEEKPLPGTEKELSVNAAEEKDGDNERSGGRVVGRAGISLREGYDEAELGYVIEKDRQNRGYATEACEAIVGYAANVLGMNGLNCFVRPENNASVRLCARLGFEYLEEAYINGRRFDRYHLDLSAS